MKKIFTATFLLILVFASGANARSVYDTKGKMIIDDSLRGQQRAALEKAAEQKTPKAAAAAKIDYEAALKALETQQKSNYYQDSQEYEKNNNIQ